MRLMTVAKTGRLIDTSERIMVSFRASATGLGKRSRVDLLAIAHALHAADYDGLSGLEAVADLDFAGQPRADLDLASVRPVVDDDKDEMLDALGNDRLFGHEDRVVAPRQRHIETQEHARPQRLVGVLEQRIDAHRARDRID